MLLIVEDEPDVRELIVDYLREEGFTVKEAANAAAARHLLAYNAPDIELVVTDVRMPGAENGVQLAKYIRQNYPDISVLLASGNVTGSEIDGERFIQKPFKLERLAQTIKAILAGEP